MAIGCGVPAPYGSNAARRTSAHRRGGVADRALDPEAVWGKFARDSLLEGGGFRTIGTPQRNNFSRPPPFNPPQFAFRKRNRLLRTRNRWFESGSLHRRVRELSVPSRDEIRPGRQAAAQHSSKAEPDQADSPACHILPRRWCGCEKSAAFVSVLDGDGHWVEYNDPVFGERMPEATAGGPVRRESHDGRDDAP